MNQLPVLLTTLIGAMLFAIFGSAEEQPWSSSSQQPIELQNDSEKHSGIQFIDEAVTAQNV